MASITSIISQVAGQFGVPAWIPLDIAKHESGLNPNANVVDTNGVYSTGLFQLNQLGLGAGHTVGQLQDPTLNSEIAIQAMAPAYYRAQAQGLTGLAELEYVANSSGWPGSAGPGHYASYDAGLAAVYNGSSPSGAATGAIQSIATAPDSVGQFTQNVDQTLTLQPVDWKTVSNPAEWFSQNVDAIGLRVALVLVGLLLVAFALVKAVGSDRILPKFNGGAPGGDVE